MARVRRDERRGTSAVGRALCGCCGWLLPERLLYGCWLQLWLRLLRLWLWLRLLRLLRLLRQLRLAAAHLPSAPEICRSENGAGPGQNVSTSG